MICYAVPTLKKNIKAIEQNIPNYSLPKNDLFLHDRSTQTELKKLAAEYKQRLSAYLWLSSFSFFEAFVSGALKELIEFHGGADKFIGSGEKAGHRAITKVQPKEVVASRAGLSGQYVHHKMDRYRKQTRILTEHNYRFPSELFSSYGIRMLVSKAGELKAAEIPDLLTQALHFDLSTDALQRFDRYRKIRNNIAHCEPGNLSLAGAFDVSKNLRRLASHIDDHLVTHFFVMERFRT